MYTDEDYDNIIEAGQIASKAREYGAKLIKVDGSVEQITDDVEKFIIDNGGQMAFPAQISLNHIAAHYCATKNDDLILKKGDMAKLDVGVHVNGFVGDTAKTIDLGNNPNIVKASSDALYNAIKGIIPNVTTNGQVGKIIEDTILKNNCAPVTNLSGHGLGQYEIHTSPSMPNFDTGDKVILKDGMHFAIEPFASNGKGLVQEKYTPEVFRVSKLKPSRSAITRSIIPEIKAFGGLPFCYRWIANKHGEPKTRFALRELLQMGCLEQYPPLCDVPNSLVSQTEHSIYIEDGKVIITTK